MNDGDLALAIHVDDADLKRLRAEYRALLTTFSTETGQATKQASQTIREFTAQTVQGEASKRRALQETLNEYRALAIQATKGSAEQIAANKLAGDTARRLGLDVAVAGRQVRVFGHDWQLAETSMNRGVRGMLAGTGVAKGMRNALVFGSSTFIGFYGLAAAARSAYNRLGEISATAAQTRAVLKSTGEVAGVSAQHIDALANAELRKTGIDNEQTKAAEDVLLTFTRIRNVGKDNIFDQATKSTLDLSKAMHEDLQTASLQVGKALNNPVIGMLALRRIGVSFTADQVKTIKKLAETNHMLDAQKLILKELNVEFGGSAEQWGHTLPGAVSHLQTSLKNLEASGLKSIEPELVKLANDATAWMDRMEKSGKLQADVNRIMADTKQVVHDVVAALRLLSNGAGDVANAVGGWKDAIELLLAVKVGLKLAGWGQAIATLIGSSTASTGLAGASTETSLLTKRLKLLQGLKAIGITVVITEILQHKKGIANAARNNIPGFNWLDQNVPGSKWLDNLMGVPAWGSGGGGGKYDYPLAAKGRIIGTPFQGTHGKAFNQAGGSDNWESENAVDISVKVGTPVVAVEGGVIGTQIGSLGTGGRFAGLRLHLIGDSGNEYYYAHLSTIVVNAGQHVKKGEVVGMSGSANGVPHLHFASKSGDPQSIISGAGTPSGLKPPRTGSTTHAKPPPGVGGGSSTHTGSSGVSLPLSIQKTIADAKLAMETAKGTTSTRDDAAAKAQLEAAVEKEISWLRKQLAAAIARHKVGKQVSITDALTSAVGELAGLKGDTKLMSEQDLAKVRGQVQFVASHLAKTLPADMRAGLKKQVTGAQSLIALALGDGVVTEQEGKKITAAADSVMKRYVALVKKHAEEIKQALQLAQGNADTALGQLAGDTLSAFDANRASGLAALMVKVKTAFGSFDYSQGGQTPGEIALAQLTGAHDQAARDKNYTDATTGLAKAKDRVNKLVAAGFAEQSSVMKQARTDLASAQDTFDQADYDRQSNALNDQITVEKDAADKKLTQAQKDYDSETALLRRHLEDKLALLQKHVDDGTETLADARVDVASIWAEFGIDAATAGTDVGSSFTAQLNESLKGAFDTLAKLKKAQEDAGITTPGADPGAGTRPDDRGGSGPASQPSTTGTAPSFVWDGRIWTKQDQAAFKKLLTSEGVAYATWTKNHPTAAAVFAADGAVVTKPTLIYAGEVARARPEIIAPQKLMAETFSKVLDERAGDSGGNGHQIFGDVHVSDPTSARVLLAEASRELRKRGRR